MGHDLSSVGAVNFRLLGRPGSKPIHIAVAHAEDRGDQDRIVDLPIGRTLRSSRGYVIPGYVLAALLYFAGDVEKRLHLGRNVSVDPIRFDRLH